MTIEPRINPSIASRTGTVAHWAVSTIGTVLRLSWSFTVWLLAKTWEGTKRCGRIILWIGFWPLGLWRSIVHSQRKNQRPSA